MQPETGIGWRSALKSRHAEEAPRKPACGLTAPVALEPFLANPTDLREGKGRALADLRRPH